MKLRHKLWLAGVPMAVATLFMGVLAVQTVSSLAHHTEAILRDNQRSILAAQKMLASLEQVEMAFLQDLVGQRSAAAATLRQELAAINAEFVVQDGNITEEGEAQATRSLELGVRDLQRAVDALASTPLVEPWVSVHQQQAEPALRRVRQAILEILNINQDAVARKSRLAVQAAGRLRLVLLAALVLALLLGILLSAFWAERALRPLQNLSAAVRSLGNQDFLARALVEGRDEISELAREFNGMAERLGVYQRSTLGELLQAQGSAQAAIDSLPDPVMTFDAAGKLVILNSAAESGLRLGVDPNEPLRSLEPDLREQVTRILEHVLSGRGAWVPRGFDDCVRLTTHGSLRWLLPRAAAVHDHKGTVVGATLVLQDVTRLRRFDELKNNLVATVAHEFRTPLTSLRMAIHLCLEGATGELNEKQKDLLHAARLDCERLQAMVDDLLDLSRIEGGALSIHLAEVETSALLARMTTPHEDEARRKGVSLNVETDRLLPPVLADQERMALVFDNLITNAIRHTPSGGAITLAAAQEGSGEIRFTVTDTGEGIAPEYHARIFEKFFRVPGQTGQGAGFGLFIAREVVNAHQGSMGVESVPGHGATFWFTLPQAGGGGVGPVKVSHSGEHPTSGSAGGPAAHSREAGSTAHA